MILDLAEESQQCSSSESHHRLSLLCHILITDLVQNNVMYRGYKNVKQFWMEVPLGGLELAQGATLAAMLSTGTISITMAMAPLHDDEVGMILTITRGGNSLMTMSRLDMAGRGKAGDHVGQAIIQTQYRMTKVLGGEEEEVEGHGGQVTTLTPSQRVMITPMGGGAGGGARETGGNDQPTLTTLMKEIMRVSRSPPTPVTTLRVRVTVTVSEGRVVGYGPAPVPLPFLMQPGHCRGGAGRGWTISHGSSHSRQKSRSC